MTTKCMRSHSGNTLFVVGYSMYACILVQAAPAIACRWSMPPSDLGGNQLAGRSAEEAIDYTR